MSSWQYIGKGCCTGKQFFSADGFSRTQCQNLCDDTANCTGYSYYPGTNWCAHFDSCGTAEFRSGCTDPFESWTKQPGLFYFIHVVTISLTYKVHLNVMNIKFSIILVLDCPEKDTDYYGNGISS